MIRLIGDRVLVLLPPKATQQDPETGYSYQDKGSSGGIILARPVDTYDVEIQTRGLVTQLGVKRNTCDLDAVRSEVHTWFVEESAAWLKQPGGYLGDEIDRVLMKLQPAPFAVQVGDCVIFPPTAGEVIESGGHRYVILNESDILGIVEPRNAAITADLAKLADEREAFPIVADEGFVISIPERTA